MTIRKKSTSITRKHSLSSTRSKTARKGTEFKSGKQFTKPTSKRASGGYMPREKAGKLGAEERWEEAEENRKGESMKSHNLYDVFIKELAAIYSAENQIIAALPSLITAATSSELKEALKTHLSETKNQVARLNQIFSMIGKKPAQASCESIKALINCADKLIKNKTKSATLDAVIIGAAQKVEHYEMAVYGTLRSFANNLDLDSEVAKLLQETLNEEGAADKKLTKIAEGSIFSTGINKEAAENLVSAGKKSRK